MEVLVTSDPGLGKSNHTAALIARYIDSRRKWRHSLVPTIARLLAWLDFCDAAARSPLANTPKRVN